MNRKFVIVCAALVAMPAHAGVGKLSGAEVNEGVFDVQYNTRRTGDDRRSRNNAQQHKVEMEYGLTDDLMVGIELEGNRRVNPGRHEFTAYGGELKYQLSAQNEGWWFNSAVKAEYGIAAQSSGRDSGETGLLLSRKDGKFKTTANFKFEREMGAGRDGGVDVATALQTVYHDHPYFSPGIEWHADYGKANNFNSPDRQEHYLGGVLMGKIPLPVEGDVSYEVGYFRGLTDVSADDAQRLRLQYKIRF